MRTVEDVAADLRMSDPEAGLQMLRWLEAGLMTVDPARAMAAHLSADGSRVVVGSRSFETDEVVVLAFGKAACGMAMAAHRALGNRIVAGLVISDQQAEIPGWAELVVGGHPIPDQGSARAAARAIDLARGVQPNQLLLALASGGGSALMAAPIPGLDVGDVRLVMSQLIRSDAPIEAINQVRSRISAVKSGRLAAHSQGPVATLVISDVVGSDPRLVATGPTVGPLPDQADIRLLFHEHTITGEAADRVLAAALRADAEPPPGEHHAVVIADASTAARAVLDAAVADGLDARLLTDRLTGDAGTAVLQALESTRRGSVGILAGETTVRVRGSGIGGRNQHAALTAAIELTGGAARVLCCGTDGRDGPTDAAGAMVDGETVVDTNAARTALADNDSHCHLDGLGALVRTGRTGTNVGDVWIVDKRAGD